MNPVFSICICVAKVKSPVKYQSIKTLEDMNHNNNLISKIRENAKEYDNLAHLITYWKSVLQFLVIVWEVLCEGKYIIFLKKTCILR